MSINLIPTEFIKSQSILKNCSEVRNNSDAGFLGPGMDGTVQETMLPKDTAVRKQTKKQNCFLKTAQR